MKEKLKHYLKEILIFTIIMAIFANIISFYKSRDLNKASLQESDFIFINKSSYTHEQNKPILIHFWATWCPTCNLEAANIEKISQHYNVITIAVKSDIQEIKKYLQDNNLHFKVVNDSDGSLARKFNISAYPTTFIYDKNKNLVFSEVGYTSTIGLWLRMFWVN